MDALDQLMQGLAQTQGGGAEADAVVLSAIEVMVAAADAIEAKDDDWSDYAGGSQAAGWLATQMSMSDQVMGRIPAAVCEAAGCTCPEGPSGKTVHMGWVRRPVVKVITKYAD